MINVYEINENYFVLAYSKEEAIQYIKDEYGEEIEDINEISPDEMYWDNDVPRDKIEEIEAEALEEERELQNGDTFGMNIRGELIEGSIRIIEGDYYVYKNYRKAMEEAKEVPVVIAEREF